MKSERCNPRSQTNPNTKIHSQPARSTTIHSDCIRYSAILEEKGTVFKNNENLIRQVRADLEGERKPRLVTVERQREKHGMERE